MYRYLMNNISTVCVYALIILGNQTDVDGYSNQKYIIHFRCFKVILLPPQSPFPSEEGL